MKKTQQSLLKIKKQLLDDIANGLSNFQVLNPDLLICEMGKNVEFEMSFTISKGRGYVSAEENIDDEEAPIGTIAIDSMLPIKKCKL